MQKLPWRKGANVTPLRIYAKMESSIPLSVVLFRFKISSVLLSKSPSCCLSNSEPVLFASKCSWSNKTANECKRRNSRKANYTYTGKFLIFFWMWKKIVVVKNCIHYSCSLSAKPLPVCKTDTNIS